MLWFAIQFHHPHDEFITLFSLFQCEYADPWIADLEQRKSFSEAAIVLRCLKHQQRSVEALRLPISLRIAPSVCVSGNPINEFMVSQILSSLVWISARRS